MQRSLWLMSVLYISLLASLSLPGLGQPCGELHAIPGALGYQHRPAADRCEGLYESPIAGESLEFLSFVRGSISYDLTTDKILLLAVPDVSQLEATVVRVRARALPLGAYYRMDANVPSGQAMEWPLNAVIAPAGLHADSLGVIGWIEKGASKIYVPVSVYPKGNPPALQVPVVVVLRSPIDIEKVQWRLWATGKTDQLPPWQVLGKNTIRAGEPVLLPIAASSETLNLDVATKIATSDEWLKMQLQLFIP